MEIENKLPFFRFKMSIVNFKKFSGKRSTSLKKMKNVNFNKDHENNKNFSKNKGIVKNDPLESLEV